MNENQFINDVINASIDTIFVFDPETGKAIMWNDAYREVCGYSDEEIAVMKAPDSYYSEDDLKHASKTIEALLETGKGIVELSLITKTGRIIPYEYYAKLIKTQDDKLLIVSTGRDITRRKENEQKLKESEKKFHDAYDRANFYKDLFAHDMYNILQNVLSSSELCKVFLEYNKEQDFSFIDYFAKDLIDARDHIKLITN